MKHILKQNQPGIEGSRNPKKMLIICEESPKLRKHTGHPMVRDRKNSSSINTNTYNEYSSYHQYQSNNSLEEDEHYNRQNDISQCASIQNGLFQNLLSDLRQEISLKSEALKCASEITKKLQSMVKMLQKQNDQLKSSLNYANQKIASLQHQLQSGHSLKSIKQYPEIESPNRGSFTKTYITQRNIPIQQQSKEVTKIISAQIFNQFCKNYTEMIGELGSYLEKEKICEETYVQKLENLCIQVQDIVSGKLDEEVSKTTYDTGFADSEYHYGGSYYNSSTKRTNNTYMQSSTYTPTAQYQQIISKYRQLCVSLCYQLTEAKNFIAELSSTLQQSQALFQQSPQPQSFIPSELISLVTKQCNKIITIKFTEMKEENLQLIHIIEEMIGWIQKNSKDGGDKFRTQFRDAVF